MSLATNKSFSTSPKNFIKRGHDIIRDRCIATIEALKHDGFTSEVPLDVAIEVFEKTTGKHDRLTIKSYFGRLETRTKRVFDVTKQYIGRETKSERRIIMRENIGVKHGYFKKLDMAHLEKRKNPRTLQERVFFVIHSGNFLVPELEDSPLPPFQESFRQSESLHVQHSIDNLSLNTVQLSPNGPTVPNCEVNGDNDREKRERECTV